MQSVRVVWNEFVDGRETLMEGTAIERFDKGKYRVNCFFVEMSDGSWRSPPVVACRKYGKGPPPPAVCQRGSVDA